MLDLIDVELERHTALASLMRVPSQARIGMRDCFFSGVQFEGY